MNMRKFITVGLALAAAGSASAAAAQTQALAAMTDDAIAEMFVELDKNRDSKLSAAELNVLGANAAKLMDMNGDGEVAPLEFVTIMTRARRTAQAQLRGEAGAPAAPPAKAAPAPKAAPADEFAALDANRDGVLTGAEFGSHRENARFDDNRDGRVSRAEWTAGQARERAGILR